jgi:membrane-bound metal-dependent hydrolase YbcI (DUF457 family)
MMGRTHVMGGLSCLLLLALVPGGIVIGESCANLGVLALCASLGALLPDLDSRESQIKHLTLGTRRNGIQPFFLPTTALHQALGHRGLLHSAAGLGIATVTAALPLGLWLGWQSAAALVLGYASHLVLDACTKSGIPLRYPNRMKCFLLPPYLRVTTGSAEEDAVFMMLAVLTIALLLTALNGSASVPMVFQ